MAHISSTPVSATPMVVRFTIKPEEDLENDELHRQGTLLLTVTGQVLSKMTYSFMSSVIAGPFGVGPGGISELYRFEDKTRWYVTLTTVAAHITHYSHLHGRVFQTDNPKVKIHCDHLDKEKQKGTLHWVPTTLKPEAVRGFL